jgi:hypothetical protein
MRRRRLAVLVATAAAALAIGVASAAVAHAGGRARSVAPEPSLLGFLEWTSCQSEITCTLSTTTTDSLPGGNTFTTSHILADYNDLALVSGSLGEQRSPEEDYFVLSNAIPGYRYSVSADPQGVGNYNLGIVVYDAAYTPILTDSNPLDNDSGSVDLLAVGPGPYYFKVFQISSSCSGGNYDLAADEYSHTSTPTGTPAPTGTPTPTATRTPTQAPAPTSIPGADSFEPNWDFDHASLIGTGITYSANFIPICCGEVDNDFYKIWVKPGLLFTCYTSDLGPGVDTNIIIYDHNRNGISGNDDVELGDYSSRISYYSTYEGWLYVLVGHGGRLALIDVENSTYSIRCDKGVPNQATPTSTATPHHVTPTASPSSALPTPTPQPLLSVRVMATPTPAPGTSLVPRSVVVNLLVYYDGNDDATPGAGEGVAGISAQVQESVSGQLLAQAFTDELGTVRFRVTAAGPVQLSVPFLGFSQVVGGSEASVFVRVPPWPSQAQDF